MTKNDKYIHIMTVIISILFLAWAILPIIILRDRFVFTIHDNLDSYAGIAQMFHDKHLYFSTEQIMPFMNGLERKYTIVSYSLYEFFNCFFGFLPGQILTRIIGIPLGFFSMRLLARRIVGKIDSFRNDIIILISTAYAITPCAPNRIIAFAALPLIIEFFLLLKQTTKFNKISLLGLFIPIISHFDMPLVFVISFWFVCGLFVGVKKKQFNINIWISFVLICVSTIIVNINLFKIALFAEETNRGLACGPTDFVFTWDVLKKCLLEGRYHAPPLHKSFLLLFLAESSVIVLLYINKKSDKKIFKTQCMILFFGWSFWLISALIDTLQAAGLRTNVLLIDGFQWGRLVCLMRLVIYTMFITILMQEIKRKDFKIIIYGILCLQLIHISTADVKYNDSMYSIKYAISRIKEKPDETLIAFNKFFAKDIFKKIKKDINYLDEGVVAYGLHPSILLFNGFNTIDGYISVHSMKWQNEFREIIAPTLDMYIQFKEYYDNWGGRMYLFGSLSYHPIDYKNKVEARPLFINVDALKKYGGKYIMSRGRITNADKLNIKLFKKYESDKDLYDVYLYKVE